MQTKTWKLTGSKLFIPSIVILALIVFYFVIKSYIDMFGTVRVNSAEAWGQFGDFVGGLTNPILSFLGLLVLLQTFRHQLESSKRQLAVSETEKFENTFFKLVDKFEAQATEVFRDPKNKGYAKSLRAKLLSKRSVITAEGWEAGLATAGQHAADVVSSDSDRLNSFGRKFSQCLYFIENSSLEATQRKFYFSYAFESFMKYELTIYLAFVFVRSPDTVKIIRKYKLASRLKDAAFCCPQVKDLYAGRDLGCAYPLPKAKPVDDDLKVDNP